MNPSRRLLFLMIAYAVASLLHFVHNAVYIDAYPNLPRWITPSGVYASWFGITTLGLVGYWLYRQVSPIAGLLVIVIYALTGFGGLDHYTLAPISTHSFAMNATILVEVAAASVLLLLAVYSLLSDLRRRAVAASNAPCIRKS